MKRRVLPMLACACVACTVPGLTAYGAAPQPDARRSLALRGGAETPEGKVTAVTLDGVSIELSGGEAPRTVVLGWDRVATVSGIESLGADAAATAIECRPLADTAWRARTRLSRGDAPGAEPLFESLFTRYEGRAGPTPAVVASGLLRCRLTRQAQAAAVRPWLALVASGEAEAVFDTPALVADGIVVPPLTDPATGLAPGLPPIWIAGPSLQAVGAREYAQSTDTPTPAPSARAALLSGLYVASARAAMGDAVTLPARPALDDGAALVWDVVAADAGTPEQRVTARGHITVRLADEATPQWIEAWCRVALGRSLLRDGSEEDVLLGMVHLLHVPSRLEHTSAYLAGVALLEVAQAQDRAGRADAAARVWRELEEKYPGHPALAERGLHAAHDEPAVQRSGGGS